MTSIFISYSRKDNVFVTKLVRDLEAAGHDVWRDLSDIQGGASWLASIDQGLKDCDVVALILSPDSVASRYIQDEVTRARSLNKLVIPLLCRKVDDLPFHLSTLQQIDFRENYSQAIEKLLKELTAQIPLSQNSPLIETIKSVPSRNISLRAVSISVIVLSLAGITYFATPLRKMLLNPGNTTPETAIPTIDETSTETSISASPTSTATDPPTVAESTTTVKETQEAQPTPTIPALPTPTQVDGAVSQVPPANPAEGTLWKDPNSGMNFAFVPAGEFQMGSSEPEIQKLEEQCGATSLDCNGAFTYEKLDFRTSTSSYWIGQTEITNAQYQKFIDDGGYTNADYWDVGWQWRLDNSVTQPGCWNKDYLQGDNKPVVCVSWYEARAFTKWLAAKSGLAIRLPTEVEWEKAARGTQGNIYPWGNDFMDGRANYCDSKCPQNWREQGTDGYATTAPVGSFPLGASPYGAMDMAGNVSEWTSSAWGKMLGDGACEYDYGYPYTADDGRESLQTQNCRMIRGGSWLVASVAVHSARRGAYSPDVNWIEHVGFRVVVSSNID